MIDLELIRLLNLLKEKYPSSTTSLDRTVGHNTAIGGSGNSYHLKGLAVDLVFDQVVDLISAAVEARVLGFGGIEADMRNNHLHLDRRPVSSQWYVVITSNKTYTLQEYLTMLESQV